MNFKCIFFTLALSVVFAFSFSGQSHAQVTWNTYEENDGLFSIQIPSNWNASKLPGTEASAPIDYIFRYNDRGNSFAWVELMISEPLYSNASTAAESYMSQYQQFDDFNLLKPIDCNTYTLNDEPACSFLSSQQLEGEQRRNVLDMVSISPDGIQTDVVFVASSNIYEPFLPISDYVIDSLAINSTAVKQSLGNQSIENIQSEIPLVPTENHTALQAEFLPSPTKDTTINQSRDNTKGNPSSTSSQTFRSAFDTFVTSEPTEFGVYDEKVSSTFSPGEDILLYIEPKGFEYGTATDGVDKRLYTIDFAADFTVSDSEGTVLGGQRDVPMDKIALPYQEKRVFIPFTITQSTPFPPGNYNITYTIHDTNSGKSFDIVKEIVISESQMV